jgi:cation diffusion facilitator CzcD-associated flavoprotein CzcO
VVDVIVIGAGLSGLVAARRHDAARPPDAQGLEVVVRTVPEGRHVAREAVVTVPIGVLPSIAFSPVVHGRRDRKRPSRGRRGRSGYIGHMAKNHGSSVKDDKQYEGLRKKGMSKERAAKIANTPGASKKGGKKSSKKS